MREKAWQSLKAQQKYCEEKHLPLFAPLKGICYSCGNNIFEKISVERASTSLITGCPFCHTSFIE